MDINQQDGDWKVTMSHDEAHEINSPPDHALAVVVQEYAISRSQINSRVVRYHDDGVTVVVSRSVEPHDG